MFSFLKCAALSQQTNGSDEYFIIAKGRHIHQMSLDGRRFGTLVTHLTGDVFAVDYHYRFVYVINCNVIVFILCMVTLQEEGSILDWYNASKNHALQFWWVLCDICHHFEQWRKTRWVDFQGVKLITYLGGTLLIKCDCIYRCLDGYTYLMDHF